MPPAPLLKQKDPEEQEDDEDDWEDEWEDEDEKKAQSQPCWRCIIMNETVNIL